MKGKARGSEAVFGVGEGKREGGREGVLTAISAPGVRWSELKAVSQRALRGGAV